MTDAQRRATKRYRARRVRQGLRRIEVQVPGSEAAVIRKAASVLRHETDAASRLRRHLGFAVRPDKALSAAAIFAMDEQPSTQTDALWDEAMAEVEGDRRKPSLNRSRKLDL